MHLITSFRRLKIKRLSCVIVFFLFFVFFRPLIVEAAELRGIVFGKRGDPKRYVRITLLGPESRTTFSNRQGGFVIRARNGKYQLIISERGNEQSFEVEIPGKGNFQVSW
ncbi:MAG: hypothetical protein PHR03_00025 [Desulfovibrionales bacterium]|nr:hypothetical protein [Desulfovibrionales bacterium]